MTGPTIIAVDWSGAKRTTGSSGIWIAAMQDGRLVYSEPASTREQAVAYVRSAGRSVIAGFDFSFGMPAWFAREHACTTIDAVWRVAEDEVEAWLTPSPPFWRDAGTQPPLAQRFRRCEERLRAAGFPPKSIFQLVGDGQVGAGSVRGMPHLAFLRASGFGIWPFDGATARTVMEIYPSLLRRSAPHHDVGPFENNHERDAVVSARVMWEHRDELAALPAATDPVTRIEGDVWVPTSSL